MTKKNINTVKHLKKIVKEKAHDDKEWHPQHDSDLQVKKLVGKRWWL